MPDDDMRVLLQLQPLSVSFAPKTFSLRPTQKIRIDLVGAGTSTSPPRPDNGVLPSPALDRNSAHIVSSGSYFTLNTSAQESNRIRVNNYLLSNNPCTLKHGDIVEFGHAAFVRYDEYYDDDGDYECWPCFSFAPDLSFKVHLTFPPRFDTRRVWTDPFSDPIAYVPPSSVPCIKPKISQPRSSPASTHVQDRVPLRFKPVAKLPPASPPKASTTPQLNSVPVSDPPAPHGTDWAGVARLLGELHAAAPLPRSSSPCSPDSVQSPRPPSLALQASDARSPSVFDSAPVDPAACTFFYGDFVGTSGAATLTTHTGTSDDQHGSVATSPTSKPLIAAVTQDLSPISPLVRPTSVSTSMLGSDQIARFSDTYPSHDTTARVLLCSAETALRRVGAAWVLARREANDFGLTSAEVAVARMGAAWRQSRGLVNDIALSLALPADRLGSSPVGSVVDYRLHCGTDDVKRLPALVPANQNDVTIGPPPALFAPRVQSGRHVPAAVHSPPIDSHTKFSLLPGILPVTASLTALSYHLIALISQLQQSLSVISSNPSPTQHHSQPPPYRLYPYLPALPPIHFR